MSYTATVSQNKLFYKILLDGVVCTYAEKVFPTDPSGYLQPAERMLSESLRHGSQEADDLINKVNVTFMIPITDTNAGHAKQIRYNNGTKSINV